MRRPWTVFHPGPLVTRREGLWTVDDEVPGIKGANRRMTVVRRGDGTLLFFNAVPVPDATLAELRALGPPRSLVVPNQYHAMDAAAFAQKLGVEAYAPEVERPALRARLECQPITALPAGDDVRCFAVEGFRTHEVLLLAGDSLLAADVFTNVPHQRGLPGLVMRAVGFTGPRPKLPPPVRLRVGRDLPAVARLLEQLAAEPALRRLIPSHGDVVEAGAADTLRAIAASLR